VRSRSPISYRPALYGDNEPLSDHTDPAHTLGTFQSAVPTTPRVGDQERPWSVTLPEDDEEKSSRRESPSQDPSQYPLPESTFMSPINPSAEDIPPPPPPKIPLDPPPSSTLPAQPNGSASPVPEPAAHHGDSPAPAESSTPGSAAPAMGSRRIADETVEPVELPARVPGDDSSEEIVMSS